MDLENFMIRTSTYLISRENVVIFGVDLVFKGNRVLSSCSNCTLVFVVYLWKLTEENLSQTSCDVPDTVGSVDLVSILHTVNTECLVHYSCV